MDANTMKALASPRVLALVLTALFPISMTLIFLTGLFVCVRHALRIIQLFLNLVVWRGRKLDKYGAHKGAWAVVTGSSDGIGREFALQLAQKGFNIVIVSRTPSKIDKVAQEISALPGCETVSVLRHAIDFAKAGPEAWTALESALAPLDIGILVNNAGLNHSAEWSRFLDASAQECVDIVTVNATSAVHVARLVLPGMVSRKRGLVLNVGSVAGDVVSPLWATYSGTKSFLTAWTQGIATELELAKTGVDVQLVAPGYVTGGMAISVTESLNTPSAARWVRCALNSIGLNGGSVGFDYVNTPYWSHALLVFVLRSLGLENVLRKYMHAMLSKELERKTKKR